MYIAVTGMTGRVLFVNMFKLHLIQMEVHQWVNLTNMFSINTTVVFASKF